MREIGLVSCWPVSKPEDEEDEPRQVGDVDVVRVPKEAPSPFIPRLNRFSRLLTPRVRTSLASRACLCEVKNRCVSKQLTQ